MKTQRCTLRALTYLCDLESPTGKKIFRRPLTRAQPVGGETLSVSPFARAQSGFLSVFWPLRAPRQAQGLNDFPLVEACLCQFAQ